jgi:hypothetical protein
MEILSIILIKDGFAIHLYHDVRIFIYISIKIINYFINFILYNLIIK